jgi:chromatin remodeling complex protein RSC6
MEPALPEVVETVKEVTPSDQLKNLLSLLAEQSNQLKIVVNSVKNVLKDVEKQSKELEKFRNKKTRVKTQRKEDAQPSGITKPVAISKELSLFLGVEPGVLVPRNEVTKGVSDYVRKNELFDPSNKQKFLLTSKPEGSKLWKLLGEPVDEVTYFNLQRYLKPHYIKTEIDVVPTTEVPTTEVPVEVTSSEEVKKKTKIIIKKKKDPLTEEP